MKSIMSYNVTYATLCSSHCGIEVVVTDFGNLNKIPKMFAWSYKGVTALLIPYGDGLLMS